MRTPTTLIAILLFSTIQAQDQKESPLPFSQIPDYPETYTAGTVVARMLDGLGFRYYWATQGLGESDLAYKPSEDSRTIDETIDHVYNLVQVIHNSAIKQPNDRTSRQETNLSFRAKRAMTLQLLEKARNILIEETTLDDHKVVFLTPSGASEYPFWNQINGPIADAIWHSGQIVMMRRAAGNPMPRGVSVFRGVRTKE